MDCCCPICGDAIEKIIIRNAEAFGVRYDIYFCDRCGVGKTWPDFVFDNEMLVQAVYFGFQIGEISCPTKYFEDASSINFFRSITYGLGVLSTSREILSAEIGSTERSALYPITD